MAGSENSIDCTIGREEAIEAMLKNGLQIVEVEDENGERHTLKEKVLLIHIEREGESIEDERFIGEIHLGGSPMETNPVTFAFQVEEECFLPFLLDTDKDGMTYCKECQFIFWDLGDEEHKSSHFIPKRVLVEINQ